VRAIASRASVFLLLRGGAAAAETPAR